MQKVCNKYAKNAKKIAKNMHDMQNIKTSCAKYAKNMQKICSFGSVYILHKYAKYTPGTLLMGPGSDPGAGELESQRRPQYGPGPCGPAILHYMRLGESGGPAAVQVGHSTATTIADQLESESLVPRASPGLRLGA